MTNGTMDWDMYDDIVKECKKLGILKSSEYGTASLKLFDGFAILSRINDKIQRLNNLFERQAQDKPAGQETIDDTLDDLINYTIYLRMLRNGGIS